MCGNFDNVRKRWRKAAPLKRKTADTRRIDGKKAEREMAERMEKRTLIAI